MLGSNPRAADDLLLFLESLQPPVPGGALGPHTRSRDGPRYLGADPWADRSDVVLCYLQLRRRVVAARVGAAAAAAAGQVTWPRLSPPSRSLSPTQTSGAHPCVSLSLLLFLFLWVWGVGSGTGGG